MGSLAPDDPLHPLHVELLAAVDALAAGPATAALRTVLDLHGPAHWLPERTCIVCGECAVLSWPPPEQPDSMWSDVVYPCGTVVAIANTLGVPVPDWYANTGQASKRIETLIERSGLGTAEAVLLRASVPDDVARRIVERAGQAGARRRADQGRLPPHLRTELWQAFAGGNDIPYFTGPDDRHWTAGVDRLLTYLATAGLLRAPGQEPAARRVGDTPPERSTTP